MFYKLILFDLGLNYLQYYIVDKQWLELKGYF